MEKKIEYISGSGLFIEGLTYSDIKEIDKYRKVKTLTLRKVKGKTIDFVRLFPLLQDIRMYSCTFDDYSALSELRNLTSLFINTIKTVQEINFDFVGNISNLRQLGIGYVSTFKKFPDLSNLVSLQELKLFNCKNLEDITNIILIPNLQSLDIVCTPQLPNDLKFIMQKESIVKMSAAFGSKKLDNEFDSLLMQYKLRR
ncbi:hypothetical protein [Bacteroides sp. FSHCM14E1]|uniref:hypothetical protein n=1 Tax=Bacteroides sp. FSHCM14E1 TaxID=2784518 RepID=UPI001C735BE9|nr:hypothetical protein [Bacteroides sp. FSHCM14E1]